MKPFQAAQGFVTGLHGVVHFASAPLFVGTLAGASERSAAD